MKVSTEGHKLQECITNVPHPPLLQYRPIFKLLVIAGDVFVKIS